MASNLFYTCIIVGFVLYFLGSMIESEFLDDYYSIQPQLIAINRKFNTDKPTKKFV